MMNQTGKKLLALTAAVTMMTLCFGFWVMNTESGRSAASRLTTISVELLMTMIHVMVDACRIFVA